MVNGPSALSDGATHQLALPRDPQDAELAVLAAFRYALGRRTYIVPVITGWLRQVLPGLRPHLRDLIAREIDAAESREGLGDACDAGEWCLLRDTMRAPAKPSAAKQRVAVGTSPNRRGRKLKASRKCEAPGPVNNC